MIIAIDQDQYNKDYILFSEKTKNNILNNGNFYRIFYSPSSFSMNGVHLYFDLQNIHLESYFNKIKCTFDKVRNKSVIDNIKQLEKDILSVCPNENKTPTYRIEEQLSQGFIKIFSEDEYRKFNYQNVQILLKISGVWTDAANYGITFRFFFNHP
tara:strand:+ start:208 stop:672 length:465 start_codon:yes stop_codon:yes gene_type:complete